MSSKRKLPSLGLQRRVRARHEEESDPETDLSSEAEDDDASGKESGDETDSGSEEAEPLQADLISFGALARAQASLPPKKRGADAAEEDDAPRHVEKKEKKKKKQQQQQQQQSTKRSSKHAPQELTSKKPVSRRREILADNLRGKARDPRFDPLVGRGAGRLDEAKAAKAYSFLDEYREGEMADLRAQIKKAKDGGEREALKRRLMSMESRRKAARDKEEEAKVLHEHRRKEKELVAQGKRPYYLKQSEQRKQLLVNRYAGMSKGQVDRAIERKRKKVSGKEKKELASLEMRRRH